MFLIKRNYPWGLIDKGEASDNVYRASCFHLAVALPGKCFQKFMSYPVKLVLGEMLHGV